MPEVNLLSFSGHCRQGKAAQLYQRCTLVIVKATVWFAD